MGCRLTRGAVREKSYTPGTGSGILAKPPGPPAFLKKVQAVCGPRLQQPLVPGPALR